MTQAELARKAGITQPTESRIEHADIGHLKSPTLLRLANALGVTTDFLLGKPAKPASSEVSSISLSRGNAVYLLDISRDLDRQQTLRLIQFAELMTTTDLDPEDFFQMVKELCDICDTAAKTDPEITKSWAYEKARSFLAQNTVATVMWLKKDAERRRQNGE